MGQITSGCWALDLSIISPGAVTKGLYHRVSCLDAGAEGWILSACTGPRGYYQAEVHSGASPGSWSSPLAAPFHVEDGRWGHSKGGQQGRGSCFLLLLSSPVPRCGFNIIVGNMVLNCKAYWERQGMVLGPSSVVFTIRTCPSETSSGDFQPWLIECPGELLKKHIPTLLVYDYVPAKSIVPGSV